MDPDGHDHIFRDDSCEETDLSHSENEDFNEEENDYLRKDVVRKFLFHHNINTCMTNNYPEANVDESGNKIENNWEYSVAPGEGHYPASILQEKEWDIKSWPLLLPDGRFGLHYKWKTKLTDQQYLCQRILNKDLRFSKSPGYIFAAAAYIEQKQLMSKANISFMRGQKSMSNEGMLQYKLKDKL